MLLLANSHPLDNRLILSFSYSRWPLTLPHPSRAIASSRARSHAAWRASSHLRMQVEADLHRVVHICVKSKAPWVDLPDDAAEHLDFTFE